MNAAVETQAESLGLGCPADARRMRRKGWINANIVFLILILSLAALIGRALGEVPLSRVGWASAVYVLGFLPGILYLRNNDVCRYLPLLPLHGLFYAFTFGFPAFYADLGWWDVIGAKEIERAFVISIAGLILLYASYYLMLGRIKKKGLRGFRITRALSDQKIRKISWTFTVLYMLNLTLPSIRELPTIGLLLENIGFLGLGGLYLMVLQGWASHAEKKLFYFIVLPIVLAFKASTGALAQILLLVLFLALIYWQVKKDIPWRYLGAIVLVYLILNPVKSEFRQKTWSQNGAVSLGALEKIELFAGLTVKYYTEGSNQDFGYTRVDRINHIGTFSHVLKETPSRVPYWNGETYEYLFVSWIPRALWPGKPIAPTGNDFGHRYGLVPLDDFDTTYNLPWLIEFYVNFGVTGALVGMSLVGALFAIFAALVDMRKAGVMEYLVALSISYGLFYAESNLALMLGAVISTYIALIIVLKISTLRLKNPG